MIDYFDVILQVISIVVIGILIPTLLKAKTNVQWKEIYEKVVIAVNAVEQIYGGELFGETKKLKAIKYLQEMGVDKSDEEINLMIEAVVHEMNKWKEQLIE